MSIQFIDRRCAVNVLPTSNGYSFVYGGKLHKCSTEKGVHHFFLKEYSSNRLETVKLRFTDKKYYLHFTLDEPEKFSTKRALRSILAQENEGAWIEEKNGKQRYFIEDGWLLSKVREVSKDEFDAHQPSSLMQKVAKFALSILSLAPEAVRTASILLPHCQGTSILGFSVLHASLVHAQTIPAPAPFDNSLGEFRVNTYLTGDQRFPVVASLINGGFVVAWQSYEQDGSLWGIFGQIYDAQALKQGPEFPVNSKTADIQENPKITGLSDGGFVIAWQSLTGDDIDGFGVYCQKFNSVGNKIGLAVLINSNTRGDQVNARPTDLLNNEFLITWQSYGQDGSLFGIFGQRFGYNNVKIGSEFQINTNTTDNQAAACSATFNKNESVVIWESYLQDGDLWGIYGQKLNANGVFSGYELRVNNYTVNSQENPAVTGLSDDGFIVAWQSYGQDGDGYGVFGRRYNSNANTAGEEFQINTYTAQSQLNVAVAGLANGDFVATWGSGGQDGDLGGIYAQKYNATIFPLRNEFQVNTNTTNDQSYPNIASLLDGGFVIVWESVGQDGDGYGIYGKRYDSSALPVINQSFPVASTLASESVSSSTINSLTISPISSAPASSSSAQPSPLSPSQTPASFDSSSFSQTYPFIPSITEILYGASNPIIVNGINVGTFEISGGTGFISGSSSNTLTIYLNPDVDTEGTFTLFSIPPGQEGQFQTIELVGQSCQSFEGSTIMDGSGLGVYQVIYQISTCASTGARPGRSPFSTMLKV